MHIICTWCPRKINRFRIRSKGIYSKNAKKSYSNLLDFNMLVVKNKQQKGIQSQNNSVSLNFRLHLILPLSVFYSKSVEGREGSCVSSTFRRCTPVLNWSLTGVSKAHAEKEGQF